MNAPFAFETAAFNRLRERLAAEFGLADDDEAVVTTAEGETNIREVLENIVRTIKDREAQMQACALQIAKLEARKDNHKFQVERLRAIVAETMLECDMKPLKPGDFTCSARMTKSAPKVVDSYALPPFYTKCETTISPDLDAIKGEFDESAAEKRQFSIPGVVISNGKPSLTIRT